MKRRSFFGVVGAVVTGAVLGKGAANAESVEYRGDIVDSLPSKGIRYHLKRVEGQCATDGDYLYVQTAQGAWRRTPISEGFSSGS